MPLMKCQVYLSFLLHIFVWHRDWCWDVGGGSASYDKLKDPRTKPSLCNK